MAGVHGVFPKDFNYLKPAVSTNSSRLHFPPVTYPEFEARWQPSGGAERANYGLFLTDLCDLLGVPRPDATTNDPTQDAYVLERAVTFDNGTGKATTGRIDLYKRGCFVLETKQGTTKRTTETQAPAPLTTKQVAARYAGAGPAKVQPIFDSLATLSLLRWVDTTDAHAA